MARTFVLYLAAESRTLYRWRRQGLSVEKRFSRGNEGLTELRQSLGRLRGALLHVVVDLPGEDFHEDQIPLLRGTERSIVIERRLAQRYRDARLAAGLTLGSTSDGRRNERLLLASIPETQRLPDWLDALRQAPVTLASIVSPGMLAPAIVARLKLGERLLLVSVNGAGLRQTFVEKGRLRLSRLEQVSADALSPAVVRREVDRTLAFVGHSQDGSGEAAHASVVCLVPDEEREHFRTEAFQVIGVRQAAKRLGLRNLPGTGAEALYLHVAALQPAKEQFLRGADRRPFVAWRLRRAALTIGASAFAACAAYAGFLWFESQRMREDTASIRQHLMRLRAEEARQRTQLPQAPANADVVKAAALEFRRIVARGAGPESALAHLSQALDQAPEVELDSLGWESTDALSQALEISARVRSGPQADHREIGRRVERFSGLLATGEWRLSARRLPFDAGSQHPLSGEAGARQDGERTRFSVTIARPLQ